MPLLADGTVRPIVDRVLPLEHVTEGYDELAADATFGKVLLDCR